MEEVVATSGGNHHGQEEGPMEAVMFFGRNQQLDDSKETSRDGEEMKKERCRGRENIKKERKKEKESQKEKMKEITLEREK